MKDCIIVGGGIAGLQAAIQLGRYVDYDVLVIDQGQGRSTLCKKYNNILGWTEGISGEELRRRGRQQAKSFGVAFAEDSIESAQSTSDGFILKGAQGSRYEARTLLLATGLSDRIPEIEGLYPTLGESVYVCPDCDGYEIQDRRTVVLGSGSSGAGMTLLLRERTKDLIYINHEQTPVDQELLSSMEAYGIQYMEQPAAKILQEQGSLKGVQLQSGEMIEAERGFVSFGGNQVHSGLAKQLGAELAHNRHVITDPRTKMTTAEHVWAAGDLAVHSELATAAMGDGVISAIWIHKALKKLKASS
ncbi:NAD(P)/FAD-dependent oxidoreductase [Paenibacillus sp. F411]|uniref:NAD(P)/FAD-dependent oxidoreductase n=1 Tax=Paenibacillus sp. F411 TaxID=2820239 RepID=UPI001AAEA97C|nr:NAD(P)/FAD-dependent oxidoreductase [Paenibacillus sp. F411]MBO2944214.1 NAD(P)/FAD-dependent oxidoreductase [Paenibacillus sp. F411]